MPAGFEAAACFFGIGRAAGGFAAFFACFTDLLALAAGFLAPLRAFAGCAGRAGFALERLVEAAFRLAREADGFAAERLGAGRLAGFFLAMGG